VRVSREPPRPPGKIALVSQQQEGGRHAYQRRGHGAGVPQRHTFPVGPLHCRTVRPTDCFVKEVDARCCRFTIRPQPGPVVAWSACRRLACNSSAADLRQSPSGRPLRRPSDRLKPTPQGARPRRREQVLRRASIRAAPTVRQCTFAAVPVLQYFICRGTRSARKGYAVVVIIPLYDEDPLERKMTPFVTYGLIAINVVVFLFELTLTPTADADFIRTFGLVPAALRDLWPPGTFPPVLTFFTYPFLHGGWVHIGGNMLFLWVFGDNVEDAVGHGRFVLFYALCGVAGGVAYVLSVPTSMAPLEGASGAIAGVVAAYLMLRPCAKIEMFVFVFPVAMAAYWVLTAWIVLQVIHVLGHSDDSVAWWAHVGGLTAGALLILGMRRPNVRLFDCRRPPRAA
jgi:membrane associated rhomboid family serine protease